MTKLKGVFKKRHDIHHVTLFNPRYATALLNPKKFKNDPRPYIMLNTFSNPEFRLTNHFF